MPSLPGPTYPLANLPPSGDKGAFPSLSGSTSKTTATSNIILISTYTYSRLRIRQDRSRQDGAGLRRRQPDDAPQLLGLRLGQHQYAPRSVPATYRCPPCANRLPCPGWGVLENYEVVRKIGMLRCPLSRRCARSRAMPPPAFPPSTPPQMC